MTSPGVGLGSQFPTLPQGTSVGSYSTYEQAKAAVDALVANEGFSVNQISVVGSDLRSVERVTGRMSAGRAALNGVMTGVMIGLFMSLMWMIVNPISDFLVIVGVFLLSIAFGVIWSLVVYTFTRNKREFTSAMQLTAGRFDLVVPNEIARQAAEILRGAGAAGNHLHDGQAHASQVPQHPFGHAVPPSGEPQAGASGPAPPPTPPGAGEAATPAPTAPAGPPKTYGEMQDELRRREERGDASPES
jgi:hypothetical protein